MHGKIVCICPYVRVEGGEGRDYMYVCVMAIATLYKDSERGPIAFSPCYFIQHGAVVYRQAASQVASLISLHCVNGKWARTVISHFHGGIIKPSVIIFGKSYSRNNT